MLASDQVPIAPLSYPTQKPFIPFWSCAALIPLWGLCTRRSLCREREDASLEEAPHPTPSHGPVNGLSPLMPAWARAQAHTQPGLGEGDLSSSALGRPCSPPRRPPQSAAVHSHTGFPPSLCCQAGESRGRAIFAGERMNERARARKGEHQLRICIKPEPLNDNILRNSF